jgi:hypothetical protein
MSDIIPGLQRSSFVEGEHREPAALQVFLANRCEHRSMLENKMANPQRSAEGERGTDMDAARVRKRLSPDLLEVLHMLDAFEARLGLKSTAL